MSKQYLTGALSPKEKYQIEDRLIENDFCFEAMEGLEQVPWEKCQHHLEETESRIIKEFSIHQSSDQTKNIVMTVLGLMVGGLLTTWYFTSGTNEPVDLSPNPQELVSAPANDQQIGGAADIKSTPEVIPVDTTSKLAQTKVVVDNNPKRKHRDIKTPATRAATQITVGRIIDTRGIAIHHALVTSGSVSDTTDKSGYYALKIAKGGTQILVTHLATEYLVEIDSNQNWEIVLDIAKQAVHDYYPMNAANRFK